MKRITKKEYRSAVDMISHLILTKPNAVEKLLSKHGIVFSGKPSKRQLINELTEMLRERDPEFNRDLSKLLMVHIKYKGAEMMALEQGQYSSYDEDEFLGGLVGGLAKGLVGGVSGLFNKKKGGGGGGNAAAQAQAQAQAAQAARLKADMDRKMQQMQAEQRRKEEEARRRREEDRRRREEEERRKRRDEEDRRRREEEDRRRKESDSKKSEGGKNNNTLLIGGGIALVAVIGLVVALRPKAAA